MKFEVYKDSESSTPRIVCKKITPRGKKSFVKDLESFNKIVDKFIKKDYKVVIKNNNLYCFGEKDYFVLKDYAQIINSTCLNTLKESIKTKVAVFDLTPKKEEKKETGKKLDSLLNKVIDAMPALALTAAAVATCGVGLAVILEGGPKEPVMESPEPVATFSEEAEAPTATLPFEVKPIQEDDHIEVLDASVLKEDIITQYNDEPQSLTIDNEYETSEYAVSNDTLVNNHGRLKPIHKKEIKEEDVEVSFEEKSFVVRQRDYLTKDMLNELLIKMTNGTMPGVNFASSEEALDYLYNNTQRTYPEKMLIVMVRENLSYNELDAICAGIMLEGGNTLHDECYEVACVGYNRYRSLKYNQTYGGGLYTQLAAPYQFTAFGHPKSYQFLGHIEQGGYQGALDAFYTRKMTNNYESAINAFEYLDPAKHPTEDPAIYQEHYAKAVEAFNILKENNDLLAILDSTGELNLQGESKEAYETLKELKFVNNYHGFLANYVNFPGSYQYNNGGNQYKYIQTPDDVLKLDYEIIYEQEIKEELENKHEEKLTRNRNYNYVQYDE